MTTKVIGLGYSKTGTTTLRECFRVFDIPFIGFEVELTRQVVGGNPGPSLAALAAYDAAANWPWPLIYREIDAAYPGSRFILTVRRDGPTWLRSLISQAKKKPRGEYREWVYGHGDPVGHEDELIARYESHNEAVRRHFADRPEQFLEVCWETGSGWRELCEFLERPIPAIPFPRANPSAPRAPEADAVGQADTAGTARRSLFRWRWSA
jgi:hypothetical protein